MIKLQTEVILPEIPVKLSYLQKAVMIGSCFTESIGMYLQELLFPIEVNPFGILYNPESIANSLEILIKEKTFEASDLFYSNGLWNSFYHHSRFSDPDRQQCLDRINEKIKEASAFLRKSNLLFCTFGTSWIFEEISSGRIVSNCHKLPAANFNRYRLTPTDIAEKWEKIISALWKINPDLKLVFTVSPIRHLKDGLHENNLSKSVLLVAIDELQRILGKERIFYFPSYEILLDEMRDYRFYASDLTHLNEVAISIIREKFASVFLSQEEIEIASEIEKLNQALKHRPVFPEEEGYQLFVEKQLGKAKLIKSKYPFLQLDRILKQFDLKKNIFNF